MMEYPPPPVPVKSLVLGTLALMFVGLSVLSNNQALISTKKRMAPSPAPTASPTHSPTAVPTLSPTLSPTVAPTASPTPSPTVAPGAPSPAPTPAPGGLNIERGGGGSRSGGALDYDWSSPNTWYYCGAGLLTLCIAACALRAWVHAGGCEDVCLHRARKRQQQQAPVVNVNLHPRDYDPAPSYLYSSSSSGRSTERIHVAPSVVSDASSSVAQPGGAHKSYGQAPPDLYAAAADDNPLTRIEQTADDLSLFDASVTYRSSSDDDEADEERVLHNEAGREQGGASMLSLTDVDLHSEDEAGAQEEDADEKVKTD